MDRVSSPTALNYKTPGKHTFSVVHPSMFLLIEREVLPSTQED